MLDVHEPINVWVFFKGTSILPFAFFWQNRQIKVESINLTYTAKKDGALIHYFAVSSGGNYYKLEFNLTKLKWFMEEVEEAD